MTDRGFPARVARIAGLAAGFSVVPFIALWAADDPTPVPPAATPAVSSPAEAAAPAIDVKKLFAAQCGWCHADYGLKEGKAPRLAGTQMTEKQVQDRIRNGKTDAMPSFRRTLTEEQIQAFAKYIKALPVQDD
jgi:mono/diheme cytochrome c family protein